MNPITSTAGNFLTWIYQGTTHKKTLCHWEPNEWWKPESLSQVFRYWNIIFQPMLVDATKRKATWQKEKCDLHNSRVVRANFNHFFFFHIQMQIDIDFLIFRHWLACYHQSPIIVICWYSRCLVTNRLNVWFGGNLPWWRFFLLLGITISMAIDEGKKWNFWKNLLMLEANIIDIVFFFDKFTPFTVNMNTMNMGTSFAADLNLCQKFFCYFPYNTNTEYVL